MSMIKLYRKDGLKLLSSLENNSIDLLLTDPPYVISHETGFKKSNGPRTIERFKIDSLFGDWDKEENQIDFLKYLQEIYRILKDNGTIIIFYDLWKISFLKISLEATKFKQIRFIEWIKTNPVPINSKINYLTNSREIALTAVKKQKPTFNSAYDNGVYKFPIYHSKDRIHPTQKSLSLFEGLIRKHSNENDIVVDPFMGSGTTAIGCFKTKRKFIGSEINKEYFSKTVERIKSYVAEENDVVVYGDLDEFNN